MLVVPGMASFEPESLGLKTSIYGTMLPNGAGDIVWEELPQFKKFVTAQNDLATFKSYSCLMPPEQRADQLPDCLWTTGIVLPAGSLPNAAAVVTQFTFNPPDTHCRFPFCEAVTEARDADNRSARRQ